MIIFLTPHNNNNDNNNNNNHNNHNNHTDREPTMVQLSQGRHATNFA